MGKAASVPSPPPLPTMAVAWEISEQQTSNLYGLLNVEASEEQDITGGSGESHNADPWSFHWSHYSNLLVFLATTAGIAWLIRNNCRQRNRNQA